MVRETSKLRRLFDVPQCGTYMIFRDLGAKIVHTCKILASNKFMKASDMSHVFINLFKLLGSSIKKICEGFTTESGKCGTI